MNNPKPLLEGEEQELEKLRATADFFDRLFNEIQDIILLIDPQNYKIVTFNQSALNGLELSEAELLGLNCHKLFYGQAAQCQIPYHTCPISQVLKTKKYMLTEYQYTTPSKKLKCFDVSVNLIHGKHDDQHKIAYVLRDITDRKAKKDDASGATYKDNLTNLYNETFFKLKLEDEIRRAGRYHRPLSLLALEVDNLEAFNALSLVEKSDFLRVVGEAVNNSIRDIDYGFNCGANKFYVIMPETDESSALIFAGRLRQIFKSRILGMAMRKESIFFNWTISIGIAGIDRHTTPDIIKAKAFSALQKAKQSGGNKICLFHTGDDLS